MASAAAAAAPPPPLSPADLKAFAQRLGLDWDAPLNSDGAPELDASDDEQLACSCAGVELALGDEGASAGVGTLHITTRRVVWVSSSSSNGSAAAETGAATGAAAAQRPLLSCAYRQIAMHAVSRDTSAFARPCVYVQLDEGSEAGGGMADDDEEEDEEEEPLTAELRFVPAQEAQVDELFAKLCECSALNPDSDLEDEAGAQLFFDEAEVLRGLPAEQRAALLAARAEGALGLGEEDGEGDEEDEADEEGGARRHADGDGVDQLMADDPGRFEDDEDEDDMAAAAAQAGGAGNGLAR